MLCTSAPTTTPVQPRLNTSLSYLAAPGNIFGCIASEYARHRLAPSDTLISKLTSMCDRRKVAVDLATGDGKVAAALADSFETVIAVDNDPRLLRHTDRKSRFFCDLSDATLTGIDDAVVDLVTIKDAIHWIDTAKLMKECSRILTAKGILAVTESWPPSFSSTISESVHIEFGTRIEQFKTVVPQGIYSRFSPSFRLVERFDSMLDVEMSLAEFVSFLETIGGAIYYNKAYDGTLGAELTKALKADWGPLERKRHGTVRERTTVWAKAA